MSLDTSTEQTAPRKIYTPLEPQVLDGQSIKFIGLGGVGGIVVRYAAVFFSALAGRAGANVRLVLVDGDSFDPSNETRMLFSEAGNKADVILSELRHHFADGPLTLDAIAEFVTPTNVERLIHSGDIVLLTVDNHATRKLVSDFCAGEDGRAGLDDVCLISGGNDGVGSDSSGRMRRGTFGNCQILVRRNGRNLCPSLTKHHPEISNPADRTPDQEDCIAALESTPQNLFANLTAASAILNSLWLYLCGGTALHYSELVFDIAEGLMRPVPRPGPTS